MSIGLGNTRIRFVGGLRAGKPVLEWPSRFPGNLMTVLSLTDRGCDPGLHGASLKHARLGGEGLSSCTAC